jgi:hypothetical protein
MAQTGSNQWGPYSANDGTTGFPNYPVPEGTATPSPTGNLVPPQSPDGVITGPVVTPAPASPGQAPPATRTSPASDNYQLSQSSTEIVLESIGENIAQQGAAAQTVAPVIAGVPSTEVQWNNAVQSFIPPATPGYGTAGNKFS